MTKKNLQGLMKLENTIGSTSYHIIRKEVGFTLPSPPYLLNKNGKKMEKKIIMKAIFPGYKASKIYRCFEGTKTYFASF